MGFQVEENTANIATNRRALLAANEIANNQADYIESQREKRRVLKHRMEVMEWRFKELRQQMAATRCRCCCQQEGVAEPLEGESSAVAVEDEHFDPPRTSGESRRGVGRGLGRRRRGRLVPYPQRTQALN